MYDERILLVLALWFAAVLAVSVNLSSYFFTSACVDIKCRGGPLSGFLLWFAVVLVDWIVVVLMFFTFVRNQLVLTLKCTGGPLSGFALQGFDLLYFATRYFFERKQYG